MPLDVPRASLYRGKINLWVEDEVTRSYLAALWNDPDVTYLIGGGNEGVKAIAQDAKQAGFRNVFAVVDRDLRPSNKADWFDPRKTSPVFVLPVHEIENYLLDSNALEACPYNNRRQTSGAIEGFMRSHAERLCWWAACCDAVAELRQRFRHDFIKDPKYPNISEEFSAIRHILEDAWFKKLGHELARSTETDIRQLVTDMHVIAKGRLNDGSWRIEFAGKQILKQVATQIVDWTKIRKPSKAEFESDLAKEVAAWQAQNQSIPKDLVELQAALKDRIQRPSAQT